ncbi:MAG TPA: class I mannose-6-phosphate isomerase [Clostridia bacterium]|nr:class I mannose-6-phosphate isomerase [Clostridia bacterium]
MKNNDKELQTFRTKPYLTNYIWGGEKLKNEWGKQSADDFIAESWELSFYDGKESLVDTGKYKGRKISDLLYEVPQVFGSKIKQYNFFPILIKLINSEKPLSVQVHPDDNYALKNEGELGKKEIWYVVEAEKDAYIYLGLKMSITQDDLKEFLLRGDILNYLNKINVKKGDFFVVDPGTIHALGPGLVVLEVQENSNLTYRLYDYNRKDSAGNSRELHIEKAIEVSNLEKLVMENVNISNFNYDMGESFNPLVKNEYFNVYKLDKIKEVCIYNKESFVSLTVLEGKGELSSGLSIKKGDTVVVPAGFSDTLCSDNLISVIAVTLGEGA